MNNEFIKGTVALFQPENPENVGAIIRICDCFNFDLHIIEPIGFSFNSPLLKNKQLDYNTNITKHINFKEFLLYAKQRNSRVILFTPHTETEAKDMNFNSNDILLFGRESSGVPNDIASLCTNTVKFKIDSRARSLNLAISVGIGLYEYSKSICTFN